MTKKKFSAKRQRQIGACPWRRGLLRHPPRMEKHGDNSKNKLKYRLIFPLS